MSVLYESKLRTAFSVFYLPLRKTRAPTFEVQIIKKCRSTHNPWSLKVTQSQIQCPIFRIRNTNQ